MPQGGLRLINVIVAAFFITVSCLSALAICSRLRLRRAYVSMREQVTWSLRHAPRDKLVLEVGAGHNPHIRSDVLCDKYYADDVHRSASIVSDRPLVIADASALPFKAHAFDVVISRHMIEHLDDPHQFFMESARVARSGLFTAPSGTLERLISRPEHRWFIEQEGQSLHFVAKNQPIYDPVIQAFFEQEVANTVGKFDKLVVDHWNTLRIVYIWNGQPQCVVEGEPVAPGFVRGSTTMTTVKRSLRGIENFRHRWKASLRNITHGFLSSHQDINWAEVLACPKCHGDVDYSETNVYCPGCRPRFPIKHGIPFMLLDYATVETRSRMAM